jgi:hypothetical protein
MDDEETWYCINVIRNGTMTKWLEKIRRYTFALSERQLNPKFQSMTKRLIDDLNLIEKHKTNLTISSK